MPKIKKSAIELEETQDNVSRETCDDDYDKAPELTEENAKKMTKVNPLAEELQQKVDTLTAQLQQEQSNAQIYKAKLLLPEQHKNLETVKLFLETVLLAKSVSKEVGEEIKVTNDLVPHGIATSAKAK